MIKLWVFVLTLNMDLLLDEIRKCKICEPTLEFGVRPVINAAEGSKIVIIGQAPGRIVHETGKPWDDKSGENLRAWLGVDDNTFYNPHLFALIPMGFCYPGKGKSGDLPPRKECAPQWHDALFEQFNSTELIVLIGSYAQYYYLEGRAKRTLTETVKHYEEYLPDYFVLPHPSPRNNIWQARNEWFGTEVKPALKAKIKEILG